MASAFILEGAMRTCIYFQQAEVRVRLRTPASTMRVERGLVRLDPPTLHTNPSLPRGGEGSVD